MKKESKERGNQSGKGPRTLNQVLIPEPPKSSKNIFLTILNWLASPSKKLRLNHQILVVAYFFAFLFIALIGYIGYYVAFPAKEDVTSAYNPRKNLFSDKIIKGQIRTSDDRVLAKSIKSGDKYVRNYPEGRLFSQVVGYDIYGKSGIEASANYYMYDTHSNIFERVIKDLKDEKNRGDTVYTTLDYDLQKSAYDALGGYNGAVVVMEPDTGKILAMVSKPNYDPNQIADIWDELNRDEDSSLLNRATQGLYPPGSTFKIVTALEYIREETAWKNFKYTCTGTTTVDSVSIKCAGNTAHGNLYLKDAMAKSCNCAFVTLASGLNFTSFRKTTKELLFNSELPINLEYSKSRFMLDGKSEKSEMPQTAIGQGKTLITPLLNCMIISAVANGGVMMSPYVLDHVESYDGNMVKKFTPTIYKEVMTEKEANTLEKMLVGVVEGGTGSALAGLKHTYAGKTGTAEHDEKGNAHAWFVGYSNVKKPDIAICVLVENGASGSGVAVPIAKQVFTTYYNKND